VVPLLLIQNDSDASASPTSGDHLDHHVSGPAHVRAPSENRPKAGAGRDADGGTATADATPSATPTTAAAPPAAPAQVIDDHVVSAVIPATTTTTTTPTTTTTTTTTIQPVATPAPSTEGTGQVTYYAHPAGTCASPWLPFGTVVRITNPANGESVSCVVNDREADTARSIDLATATFAQIAPLSQGVINAELSW
jgi:rare lipoprotein A